MPILRTLRLCSYLNPQKFTQNNFFKSELFSKNINNVRNYAASTNNTLSPSEKMQNILQKRFPKAKKIEVNDMSGGCGSMYEIFVETVEFEGLPLVKQHMLVNETLKEQIKNMHGLTVKTKIADGS